MCISRKDFNRQCLRFVTLCRELDDQWNLLKEESRQISEIVPYHVKENELDDTRLMLVRSEYKLMQTNGQVYTYEYNVIHSDSYEVPVMYFSISKQDGSLLVLDDTSLYNFTNKQNDVSGEFVNQVEHPILFRPFYMIHPCRTKDFMKPHNSSNYLICWLSTIGTVINLRLNLKLSEFCL